MYITRCSQPFSSATDERPHHATTHRNSSKLFGAHKFCKVSPIYMDSQQSLCAHDVPLLHHLGARHTVCMACMHAVNGTVTACVTHFTSDSAGSVPQCAVTACCAMFRLTQHSYLNNSTGQSTQSPQRRSLRQLNR
jgi:hypothetical protein